MTIKEIKLENLGSGLELSRSKIDMRSIEENEYKEIGFVLHPTILVLEAEDALDGGEETLETL